MIAYWKLCLHIHTCGLKKDPKLTFDFLVSSLLIARKTPPEDENVSLHSHVQGLQPAGRVCGQTPLFLAQRSRGPVALLAQPRGAPPRRQPHPRSSQGAFLFCPYVHGFHFVASTNCLFFIFWYDLTTICEAFPRTGDSVFLYQRILLHSRLVSEVKSNGEFRQYWVKRVIKLYSISVEFP